MWKKVCCGQFSLFDNKSTERYGFFRFYAYICHIVDHLLPLLSCGNDASEYSVMEKHRQHLVAQRLIRTV